MKTRAKNNLGQYFTPRPIADLMVRMIDSAKNEAILEPSSGEGVFLDSLVSAGYQDVAGVEVDSLLASHPTAPVFSESFVTWTAAKEYSAVIGNPPYIRWKDMDDSSKKETQEHPLWGSLFNALTDFLTVFIAKSVDHLKDGGELIFVTPRFWMHTKNSAALRDWLLDRGNITDIVDFEEASVFPGVSSSIIIFKFVKGPKTVKDINLYRYLGKRAVPADLSLDNTEQFEEVKIPNFKASSHWTFSSLEEQKPLNSLESSCLEDGVLQRLGSVVDIANGLVSGLDDAFRLTPEEISQLNAKEKAAALPVLKAKNINRVKSTEILPYIITPKGLTEPEFKTNYPVFYARLAPRREALLKRHSYSEGLKFWEWAFLRSEAFHLNGTVKIMVPCKERLTGRDYVRFTLSPKGAVATQDVTAFAPKKDVRESIEYIIAWIALPEVTEWVKRRGLMKGGVAEFSEQPLSQIPFRKIDWSNNAEVFMHDKITHDVKALQSSKELTADPTKLLEIHTYIKKNLFVR